MSLTALGAVPDAAGGGGGVNPLIFDEQVRLTIDHFSWFFLRAPENAWAMSHVLNPLLMQLIFQNWYFTVIMFFVWESVEVLALVLFKDYTVFVGDASDYEPIADSLLGDPFNGVLGLLLAFTFVIAFRMPHWMPSLFGRARRVFWRRVLLYVLMISSFLAYNAVLQPVGVATPVYVGVYASMALHTVWLSVSWLWLDEGAMEWALFWGGKTDASRRHRTQIYLGWMVLLVLFQLGGTYYITYVYYQVWLLWAIAVLALMLFTAAQGRLLEFVYFWSWEYRKQIYADSSSQWTDADFAAIAHSGEG